MDPKTPNFKLPEFHQLGIQWNHVSESQGFYRMGGREAVWQELYKETLHKAVSHASEGDKTEYRIHLLVAAAKSV